MQTQEARIDAHQKNPWLQVSLLQHFSPGHSVKILCTMSPIHPRAREPSQSHTVEGIQAGGDSSRPPSAECPRGPSGSSIIVGAGAFALTVSTNCPPKSFCFRKKNSVFNVLPHPFSTLLLDFVVFACLHGKGLWCQLWVGVGHLCPGVSQQGSFHTFGLRDLVFISWGT